MQNAKAAHCGVSAARIAVTVVWATPDRQDVVALSLPAGASVATALSASGLVQAYALSLHELHLGVYGRRAALDRPLADGDRVEIYRPLQADPKDARRARIRPHKPPAKAR